MKIAIYLLFCALFCGCAHRSATVADDFTVPLFEPHYARGFRIMTSASGCASTIVEIYDPWQGARDVSMRVFVSRGGESAPEGFRGVTVCAPVQRAVCMSSSYVAMFDAIGCAESVAGVSGRDFISCEYVRNNPDKVADVGWDTSLDFERVVSLRPDVMLIYGIDGADTSLTGKLDETGIPYIYIGDYVEQSPLGKAEWAAVIAELCDCRGRASALIESESRMYDSLKRSVMAVGRRPAVIFNTPYRDVWFMPPAESYMVRLAEDAGGRSLFRGEGTSSQPVGMEQAYAMLASADVWLNVSCASLRELRTLHPKIDELFSGRPLPPAWHNNRRAAPAGGSDFWESGVVHPSVVLGDLIKILHPELSDGSETIYYSPLQ